MELRITAAIFSAVLTCAAACGSDNSGTEHRKWCSDSAVVTAAGGAAEYIQWGCRWYNREIFSGAADDSGNIFSGFDVCS